MLSGDQKENWHSVGFYPEWHQIRSIDEIWKILSASAWCQQKFGQENFTTYGEVFYFRNQDDLTLFQLTWQ